MPHTFNKTIAGIVLYLLIAGNEDIIVNTHGRQTCPMKDLLHHEIGKKTKASLS